MRKLFTIFLISLSLFCKAQIITQVTTPSTISSIVPGYSQVNTYNTQTFSYTPTILPPPKDRIDEDTTTEVIKELQYADPLTANVII